MWLYIPSSTEPARDDITYASLYAGGGGLDLGFNLAVGNARPVLLVERDMEAAALLVDHMQAGTLAAAPLWADTGTLDCAPFADRVDFIVGGFPCQPASVAGDRKGLDDARWLWPHIARLVREIRPSGLFLENVPGLLTVNDGAGFGQVLRDLAALGFDAEWGRFRASDIGAPHRRERLFILAYSARNGGSRFDWTPGRAWWRRVRGIRDGVADPGQPGLEGRVGEVLAGAGSWRQHPDAGRPSEFPPGPSDTAAWGAVLAGRPDLAPAVDDTKSLGQQFDGTDEWQEIRRQHTSLDAGSRDDRAAATESGLRGVADGLAPNLVGLSRAARLRILGNGVVPEQAAHAFRSLAERFGG